MFWIDANPGFNRVMIAFIFSLLVVEQLFQLFQFQMFQFSFHYSSGFSSRFRYQLDIESDRGLIGNHLEKGRFETGGAKLAMNDARLDRRRRVQDRCFLFVESRHSIRLRSRIKAGGSTDRLFRLARCAEGGWEGGGRGLAVVGAYSENLPHENSDGSSVWIKDVWGWRSTDLFAASRHSIKGRSWINDRSLGSVCRRHWFRRTSDEANVEIRDAEPRHFVSTFDVSMFAFLLRAPSFKNFDWHWTTRHFVESHIGESRIIF